MATPCPTTPVPDDCPVCLEPLGAGFDRVEWCIRHHICRDCGDTMFSRGDHRCPLCRVPWLFARRRAALTAPPPGDLDELDENPLEDMLWEPEGLREYVDNMLWEPEGLRVYLDNVLDSIRARQRNAGDDDEDAMNIDVDHAAQEQMYTEDRRGRHPEDEDEDEIPMYVRAYSLSY